MLAPLLALALAAADPIAGCEVYDKGVGVGLAIQCPGNMVVQVVTVPKASSGQALLDTLFNGARPTLGGAELQPIETVVAGQKHRGYRLVPGKAQPVRVGSSLLFENEGDNRLVSCLAPAAIVESRCPAVFERLGNGPLPAVTHVETVKRAPYTEALFGGEPELKPGCAFTDGNTIVCKHGSVFFGSLKSHDDPKDLISSMRRSVPSGTKASVTERDCDVAGAHPSKCQVLTAGDGTVHSFAILADVQLDTTWYRIECRARGSIAKGPAPSPCQQLISFTTDVAGDEEPRETQVLVFNKSLAAGAIVGPDDISVRDVPASLATTSIVRPKDAPIIYRQRIVEAVEEADPVYWAQIAIALKLAPCGKEPKPLDFKGVSVPYDRDGKSIREVVVAATDLEEGRVITYADLSARKYRSDLVGRNVPDATAVKKLIGQKTIAPVQAGDPLRLPFLSGYADQATRCRVIKEELGNVFDDRGPPKEIAKLPCAAGTHAMSLAPKLDEKDQKPRAVGWLYQCLLEDGTAQGPFGKWTRRGDLIAMGAFAHGKRDGAWTAPGSEMHFSAGELDGIKTDFNTARTYVETASFKRGWREGPQKVVTPAGTAELQFAHGVPTHGWNPGKGTPVMVAAHELHAGDVLAATDLTTALIDGPLLDSLVEADAIKYVVGQSLLCNVAKGAPVFRADFDLMLVK